MNFCNNFVSVHQFTTATKVVGLGCIQQSAALIPVTTTDHYHNHSNICNVPNNIQVDLSNSIQHDYHSSSSIIPSLNIQCATKPTTVSSKTMWIDGVINHSDFTELALPNLPSQTQVNGHDHKPLVKRIPNEHTKKILKDHGPIIKKTQRKILVHSVSTMTDFNPVESHIDKQINKDSNEEDSSKSSLEEDQLVHKFTCYNVCSNIHLKSNTAAMAQYLRRLQPSSLPHDIREFLEQHSINVDRYIWKSKDIKDNNFIGGIPETQFSSDVDGSVLYCCSDCRMTFPQKEVIDQHISVHQPERKYECNVCGMFLKRKEDVDQHKHGHSEVRPFVCDICFKGFKRNEHLRRHIVIHSGDKCHLCVHCGKAFSRKDHLNKHLQTHVSKQSKPESNESQPISPPH